ncbi:MAG: trigger factor [Blastocatellia bacterium]|nr:trigger factor [Blastocatellia bacterium]MCS7158412.1 trigger factor [Blastocatellia bacterium]MCX7752918.1 trigger factor [Blastocatellia bacterium]MDW8167974.1 trigger factor [Acidobacteriota bacterium]MDW8256349.1 trigger factor [Acidobacteriota bacterium]
MAPKVEVRDISECRKELFIELPAEEVRAELESVYNEFARRLTIPGFRPGRVPLSVARQRFKREAQEELQRRLIPQLIEHALSLHQWRLAARPEIADFAISDTEPLRMRAIVEIFPHIEVRAYRGLRAVKRVRPVTDQEIEEALERLRQAHAVLVPVEGRPVEIGDQVTLLVTAEERDAEGKFIRRLLDREELTLELTPEQVSEDPFAREVVGLMVGQEKTFSLPADSGKTIRYTVSVTEARHKEVPELDDEFAQMVSQRAETLDELRELIRQELERRHAAEAEAALREQLLDRLLQEHPFEVPPTVVERLARERLQRLARALAASGEAPAAASLDWEQIARRRVEEAARDVRAMLILDRIAEQEGIEASDAEVEAEIARWAAERQMPASELRSRLTKEGGLDTIRNEIRRRKALEVVVAAAEVETEVAPPAEEEQE